MGDLNLDRDLGTGLAVRKVVELRTFPGFYAIFLGISAAKWFFVDSKLDRK